jgi:hypothetical protein
MKLRIEPFNAKKENYSAVRAAKERRLNSRVLDFVMQRQELPKWCWAAISSSLAHYYRAERCGQHEIASALLGFDCSRFRQEQDVRSRCDDYAMLDEALRLARCYSHWSPERPTFERICGEIDHDRPVCVHVQWHRGGSHYVVVTGYYFDSGELYVEDPSHGPSVQNFETFPRNYRMSGGLWRGTFWTCAQG